MIKNYKMAIVAILSQSQRPVMQALHRSGLSSVKRGAFLVPHPDGFYLFT
jgi:hypothetical protein